MAAVGEEPAQLAGAAEVVQIVRVDEAAGAAGAAKCPPWLANVADALLQLTGARHLVAVVVQGEVAPGEGGVAAVADVLLGVLIKADGASRTGGLQLEGGHRNAGSSVGAGREALDAVFFAINADLVLA